MPEGDITLADARGRKYLTREEHERFLATVRSHPKPAVHTLVRTRAAEVLGVRACDVGLVGGGGPDLDDERASRRGL